jgi:hypothetical protein
MHALAFQALDALLTEVENKRNKLVVVLAGYRRPMEELMAYNEGLPSRFPDVFTFPDYTDDELLSILNGMVHSERFRLDDAKHGRIAARRCLHGFRPVLCCSLVVVFADADAGQLLGTVDDRPCFEDEEQLTIPFFASGSVRSVRVYVALFCT